MQALALLPAPVPFGEAWFGVTAWGGTDAMDGIVYGARRSSTPASQVWPAWQLRCA